MSKDFSTSPAMVRRMSPDLREQLMARSAAARAYIEACLSPARQERAKLFAFMSLFHPDVPDDRVREMARDL
jgi:hypothetical protein